MRSVDVGFRRIPLLAQSLLFGIVLARRSGSGKPGHHRWHGGRQYWRSCGWGHNNGQKSRHWPNEQYRRSGRNVSHSLPAGGKYDVTATMTGFQTVTQAGIDVLVSTTTPVNFTLALSAVAESVVVSAGGTTIASESSDVGTVIDTRQVVELPLALGGVGAMRSPEAFMFLAPGVTGPGTANSNNGIFISKVGGGQNFGNEVLLDGASTLRAENGSSFDEAGPSVEAIREFKVLTSTFPAEYDHTTGGVESFTTKSGGNTYHGTAYDILRNDAFNANTWFNNAFGTPRPIDKKNDYGLNLGGPVWLPKVYNGHDRTFFFFNWEQYRENSGNTTASTVLTDAVRNGDLSAYLTNRQIGTNACNGITVFEGQIFDPATTQVGPGGVLCRTAFPENKIPANRISTVAKNFLTYMPTANQPGIVNAMARLPATTFSARRIRFTTRHSRSASMKMSPMHTKCSSVTILARTPGMRELK